MSFAEYVSDWNTRTWLTGGDLCLIVSCCSVLYLDQESPYTGKF
jgi:hypothetical protein